MLSFISNLVPQGLETELVSVHRSQDEKPPSTFSTFLFYPGGRLDWTYPALVTRREQARPVTRKRAV